MPPGVGHDWLMRAWVVERCRPIDHGPLSRVDRPEPTPGPGHEVVGRVEALGSRTTRFVVGDRAGVAWLGGTDGSCRFCRRGQENLCAAATFTGWDVDGGYAEACLVDEQYAYRLPPLIDDEHAAPLLCAGIIGYRALRRSSVPAGGRLGIYGFGASAHLTLQLALHLGMRVHVFTRSEHNRELAASLGADSVGCLAAAPPNCSMARSCSLRPATSFRSHCGR